MMMVLLFKQSIHLKTNKKRNSRFILKRPRREMWQNLGKECDEKFEAHEMSPMTDEGERLPEYEPNEPNADPTTSLLGR